MRRRTLLEAGAASVTSLTVAGCSGGDGGSGESSSKKVKLLEHEFYRDGNTAGVTGLAQNTTERKLPYVKVSVKFHNADGEHVADGMADASDLPPNIKWEFDALFGGNDPSKVDSYDISVETTG